MKGASELTASTLVLSTATRSPERIGSEPARSDERVGRLADAPRLWGIFFFCCCCVCVSGKRNEPKTRNNHSKGNPKRERRTHAMGIAVNGSLSRDDWQERYLWHNCLLENKRSERRPRRTYTHTHTHRQSSDGSEAERPIDRKHNCCCEAEHGNKRLQKKVTVTHTHAHWVREKRSTKTPPPSGQRSVTLMRWGWISRAASVSLSFSSFSLFTFSLRLCFLCSTQRGWRRISRLVLVRACFLLTSATQQKKGFRLFISSRCIGLQILRVGQSLAQSRARFYHLQTQPSFMGCRFSFFFLFFFCFLFRFVGAKCTDGAVG